MGGQFGDVIAAIPVQAVEIIADRVVAVFGSLGDVDIPDDVYPSEADVTNAGSDFGLGDICQRVAVQFDSVIQVTQPEPVTHLIQDRHIIQAGVLLFGLIGFGDDGGLFYPCAHNLVIDFQSVWALVNCQAEGGAPVGGSLDRFDKVTLPFGSIAVG